MFDQFRQSMTWMHTWFGLVLGYVLMVCFFFGSLSVFDREIDRWAIPETRFDAQPMPSFDEMLAPIYDQLRADAESMEFAAGLVEGALPSVDALKMSSLYAYTTHRDPVLGIGASYKLPNTPLDSGEDYVEVYGYTTINPLTGERVADDQLKLGSDFFYPMHYSLHLHWNDLGYWIVGLAAFIMMAALVSGVVMHRKMFREFFTFRPAKRAQRRALDLHNLTGVVALPFHFFFAFTGLVIFASIYFQAPHTLLDPLHQQAHVEYEQRTGLPLDPAGEPAALASVDAMVVEAKRRWAARDMAGEVGYLLINHIGDKNAYVSLYRAGTDQVALTGQGIHFRASTGEVMYVEPPLSVVGNINEFLTGLHLQHFEHWLLRWLYVIGGLLGCVCLATGFIFFVEKRKSRHAKTGSQGSRVVDAMAVTTVTGMVLATFAMLVANRLLPADLPDKGGWEESIFWWTWIAALVHAFVRSGPVALAKLNPAWREQATLLAVLAGLAVILNGLTTGDHLLKTLITDPYWPVAGVDLTLLASAMIAGFTAKKLYEMDRAEGARTPGQAQAQPLEHGVPGAARAESAG